MDAGSTQGARIMICGHRLTSHKAKTPLADRCDDAGVASLRHSDYGRIIFCGYVRIRCQDDSKDHESCAGKPDQARGVNGNAEQTEAVR
ncbi:hypothetical protein CQ13_36040 [Bradyrhizobium retamae]|uniref:Uncharacterized protein n=2 Tax=Bradyrhizobium retamae TaxID=1300035 RepID=A0A0R3MIR0_9BRAD|nr:hypothetical protein CQ13_36040 [Bradyrhizobium retamae]